MLDLPAVERNAIERVLSAHLGTEVRLAAEPLAVSGGFWATIHRIELVPDPALPAVWARPLVVRVMPSRSRAIHETAFHRAVAASGFPTPAVLHSGDDPAIGGAFMVMPFVDGRSPMSGLGLRAIPGVPGLLRRLPLQLADVAVELHRVDPGPVRAELAAAGVPDGADGEQSRLDALAVAATTASRGFDTLLDWFERRRRPDLPRVVTHGDLHPFNLLVDESGRTTVVDWTNGDFMPREFEIGFAAGFLRCPPIGVPRVAKPGLRRLGNWLADRFVARYEESSRLDPDALQWFEALQHGRCLAEVATARAGLSNIVGAQHPFEISASEMIRRLTALTGVTVELPPPRHG